MWHYEVVFFVMWVLGFCSLTAAALTGTASHITHHVSGTSTTEGKS